jgi:hypothetical protein
MNRRDELDAMYVILRKGCAGMNCTDCPGVEYDHCGDYSKAVKLYDAGWRRQIEAEWTLHYDGSGTCSNCHFTQRGVYDQDSYQRYCGCCGAKMKLKGAE